MVKFESLCHFMKIDVEGMEEDVLRGSEAMIRECKPVMYIENDRQDKAESLVAFIKELGYDPYWHCTKLYNPNNYFKNPNNFYEDMASLNMLCVPRGSDIKGLEPVTKAVHPNFTYTR
jgi:hypothetical protein